MGIRGYQRMLEALKEILIDLHYLVVAEVYELTGWMPKRYQGGAIVYPDGTKKPLD